MAIETPEELRTHLQWAIEVELSTIPTYLYAMYSIEDDSSEPYRLIRSVVVEEMLHLVLAANVLVAVDGRPRFYDEDVVPSYPTPLPHRQPELTLDLRRCSPEVVGEVFTTIERPRPVEGLPEDHDYQTVGQFYRAVQRAIEAFGEEGSLFESCNVDRQLGDPDYYGPVEFDDEDSGGLHAVEGVATAKQALDTVIHQGEGYHEEGHEDERYADLGHREMTHYHKFERIAGGEVPLGETRPVTTNPGTADFPEPLRPVSDLFNACYCYALVCLERAYEPVDPGTRDRLVADLYRVMRRVMPPLARFLTERPIDDEGTRAGPTFEFYRFDPDGDPAEELRERCAAVVERHDGFDDLPRILERVGRSEAP